PIFHVNADHPQAAVRMIRLALAYRQRFQRDVVVDLVCYRRWGHNETDEPAFTQPLMVEKIRAKRSVRKLATERLLLRDEIDLETAERMLEEFQEYYDRAHREVRRALEGALGPSPRPDLEAREGLARAPVDTAVGGARLEMVLEGLSRVPDGFEPHPKLLRQLRRREERFREDRIDWGTAELLAFGCLVKEGTPVRLSGQDSARGTFSQRHAVLLDHRSAAAHLPLQHIAPEQAPFQVYDSLLSELAVLGFEYGYSVVRPEALVIWEAQFGDFVNGAQVILDQYISSAEEKWGQRSSLVMLLPHGHEGQGPEHSSARLERFLQLASEGNLRIAQPSTPAQHFHLLRRQALAEERKPLVVMTPKSLLRLPAAVSRRDELTGGTFREVIGDERVADGRRARRLILTSGKLYYHLAGRRAEGGIDDVALARIEQFYPFPRRQIGSILEEHAEARQVVWAQEEPRNMGAWDFLDVRLRELLQRGQELSYLGRPWGASPATGSHARHVAEERSIVEEALGSD
ncbi:MAG: thiamine pyrophosphate-dependent enzyme, partial [Planctomycetota bacterium]